MLPQKFFSWSEHICFTGPQMAMKHLKAFMKQIWCLLCPLVDQQSPVPLANHTSKDKGTYASFVSHNTKASHTNDTFSKMPSLMLRLISTIKIVMWCHPGIMMKLFSSNPVFARDTRPLNLLSPFLSMRGFSVKRACIGWQTENSPTNHHPEAGSQVTLFNGWLKKGWNWKENMIQ